MDVEECRTVLFAVAAVKMPRVIRVGTEPDPVDVASGEANEDDRVPLGARQKIEQLESYLLLTAEARQEATEARLYMQAAIRELQRKWRALEGWESFLLGPQATEEQIRKAAGKATEPQVQRAKAQADPDLAESIESAEWLAARLTEQIKRLQHDDDVASRVYTLITGG